MCTQARKVDYPSWPKCNGTGDMSSFVQKTSERSCEPLPAGSFRPRSSMPGPIGTIPPGLRGLSTPFRTQGSVMATGEKMAPGQALHGGRSGSKTVDSALEKKSDLGNRQCHLVKTCLQPQGIKNQIVAIRETLALAIRS